MEKKGKIIIIVAPSGTGKSTLLKMLFDEFPRLKWSVSTTTRPPRSGEVEGKDYLYVSKSIFLEGIQDKEFLEWALVHNNYYGTSKTFINNEIDSGNFVVCDLDVQGADQVKEIYKDDAVAIFIEPPSIESLEKRLKNRATESTEIIKVRLQNAKKELMRKNDYDYLVKNDELDFAYQELKVLFREILGV